MVLHLNDTIWVLGYMIQLMVNNTNSYTMLIILLRNIKSLFTAKKNFVLKDEPRVLYNRNVSDSAMPAHA